MAKNVPLIYGVLVLSVTLNVILVTSGLTLHSSDINKAVFGKKHISAESDKKWLAQTLGLWLSIFLFSIAGLIMTLRIVTQNVSPASGKDPIYINTLNRIIANTIEQSVIFVGLFAPLLFSDIDHVSKIGGQKILAIASLFVVGRILFAIGYILGLATGISTFRALGFAIGVSLNVILITYHLGFNSFGFLNQHVRPFLESFI